MATEIIIDGENFSDLEGFFCEIENKLTKDLDWNIGRNMSALHDVLRGGFGVFAAGESVRFVWKNSAKSRADLGYEQTALYWEKKLKKAHPSNSAGFEEKLENAKNSRGETLFDMIVAEFGDKSDVYDHTLVVE